MPKFIASKIDSAIAAPLDLILADPNAARSVGVLENVFGSCMNPAMAIFMVDIL